LIEHSKTFSQRADIG